MPVWPRNKIESTNGNELQKSLFTALKESLTAANFTATLPPATPDTQPSPKIEVHSTKSVPATHDELIHILAELPKAFAQNPAGSPEEQIKALGTKVWALDFDRGPASFWTEAHETGQQTFPERLPAPFLGAVWRVENPRAHILMWIQPREETVNMSPATLSSVRKRTDDLPDYEMGIDVDGKSVLRQTHDPGLSKPQIPLWFGWINRELQESSGAIHFDPKTGILRDRNQAMVFIREEDSRWHARSNRGIWPLVLARQRPATSKHTVRHATTRWRLAGDTKIGET